MNKYTATFALFLITLTNVVQSFPVDFHGLEMTERSRISKFQNWHSDVLYNTDLMRIAKNEAMRLARLGKLEAPTFTLGGKNFLGHSTRITGYDVDFKTSNFTWIGQSLCFNNLNGQLNTVILDAFETCEELGIIYEQFYAVGFGIASDGDVGYTVRLFLTNQSHYERSNVTVKVD